LQQVGHNSHVNFPWPLPLPLQPLPLQPLQPLQPLPLQPLQPLPFQPLQPLMHSLPLQTLPFLPLQPLHLLKQMSHLNACLFHGAAGAGPALAAILDRHCLNIWMLIPFGPRKSAMFLWIRWKVLQAVSPNVHPAFISSLVMMPSSLSSATFANTNASSAMFPTNGKIFIFQLDG
jgi:hypothetical protein